MQFFEVVDRRRSIRNFRREKKIPREDLEKILETAVKAPSAGNRQSWEFIVVTREEVKMGLAKAALSQTFLAQAPVVVVVCANKLRSAEVYGQRGSELYCIQDTAAAIQTMLLTITALGYGSCWIGAFNESSVKTILHLPHEIRPVAILPIGVPKRIPKPTSRIPVRELVHNERY
ncbi:MAG: nitroreductase family protein [Candidatus Helarchaeota archaeon]